MFALFWSSLFSPVYIVGSAAILVNSERVNRFSIFLIVLALSIRIETSS